MNTTGINTGLGGVAATISDNTVFQVAARYTIGPVKLFAGYEWISSTPTRTIRWQPGAFIEGGYTVFAPNNTNFTTDKVLQTFWAGARYSATRDLDLTARLLPRKPEQLRHRQRKQSDRNLQ